MSGERAATLAADEQPPPTLDALTDQVVRFQRFVLRRAWGVFYAAWALAIVAYTGLSTIVGWLPPLAPWTSGAVAIGILVIATIPGLIASLSVIETGIRTGRLTSALLGPRSPLRVWVVVVVVVVLFVVILTLHGGFGAGPYEELVAYSVLVVVGANLWRRLRVDFETRPIEGSVALGGYALGVGGSLAAGLLHVGLGVEGAAWIGMGLVWLFCSSYALYHAPDELEEADASS
jgi:hypothetical protein